MPLNSNRPNRNHLQGLLSVGSFLICFTGCILQGGFARTADPKCCKPTSDGVAIHQTVSPLAVAHRPQRVVLIHPANRQDRVKEQTRFTEALARFLRMETGIDVVVSTEFQCEITSPMRSGVFDERRLVDLSHRYRADAVLYTDVEQFSGYDPMRLDVTTLMVSIDEAIVLASTSASVDLKNPFTSQYYRYTASLSGGQKTLDVHRHAPNRFIEFAAERIAKSQAGIWNPPQIATQPSLRR